MFVPIILMSFLIVVLGCMTVFAYVMGIAAKSAVEVAQDYVKLRQDTRQRQHHNAHNPAMSLLRPGNRDAGAKATLVRPAAEAPAPSQELLRPAE